MTLVRRDLLPIYQQSLISVILKSLSFVRSENAAISLINNGLVELNGVVVKSNLIVSQDDSLVLLTPRSLEPSVDSNYSLVFQDDFILVVNKPSNLPVHPTGKYYFNSLVSILKSDYPGVDLHPVHRLDRETSGLVVFAKSKSIAKILFKQFRDGSVKKTYLAIVHGLPHSSGSFSFPLVESSFGDIRNAVLPVSVGKISRTDYSLISSTLDSRFSLVRIVPKSGKKHQIRVHFSTAGFPIVGDKIYGFHPEMFSDFVHGNLSFATVLSLWFSPSHLLHCSTISFKHPETGVLVEFNADFGKNIVEFMNTVHFSS